MFRRRVRVTLREPLKFASLLHVTMMLSSSLRVLSRYPSRCYPVPLFCRNYAATPGSRPLLGRYNHVPVELARVQSGTNVRLRDYEQQKALKRFSYDLKLSPDGLVLPATGDNFIGTRPKP